MSEQCNLCRSCQWLYMQLSSRFHRNILWNKYVLTRFNGRIFSPIIVWNFLDLFSKFDVHSVGSFAILAVSDINDCVNNSCLNNATCIDQINGYTCNCSIGFTGAFCETGEIFIWHAIRLYGNLSLVFWILLWNVFDVESRNVSSFVQSKTQLFISMNIRKMIDKNQRMFAVLMHWQ